MGKLRICFIVLPIVVIVLVIIFTVCYVTISKRTSLVPQDESLSKADDTLVLVHVLFRHGDRVPNGPAYSTNPINNTSFYPEGYGQISEAGKKVAYRIGTSLNKRYGWFLGPTWNIKYTDAISTNVPRTKMTLQLMLAGLWPPTGNQIVAPMLNWQPIPFDLKSNGKELSSDKICQNFKTMKREVENSAAIQQALSVYKEYWGYFSNVTGDNVTTLQQVFDICQDQIAQRTYGYQLENWVISAMPILEKMTREIYYMETNTTKLKSIAGGYLLKKMITDSSPLIDETITEGKKIYIYSAHERNLAHFLITLGVYDDEIPTYGAQVLVELHLVDGVYGFKIYYQDWSTKEPKLMTVPGCQAFCPFNEFQSVLQNVIPEDDYCVLS